MSIYQEAFIVQQLTKFKCKEVIKEYFKLVSANLWVKKQYWPNGVV